MAPTSHEWTEGEIEARLGMSTVAFGKDDPIGRSQLERARKAGITQFEICGLWPRAHYDYHNPRQIADIRRACEDLEAAIVAVHGPNVPFFNEYDAVRQAGWREATHLVVASSLAVTRTFGCRTREGEPRTGKPEPRNEHTRRATAR